MIRFYFTILMFCFFSHPIFAVNLDNILNEENTNVKSEINIKKDQKEAKTIFKKQNKKVGKEFWSDVGEFMSEASNAPSNNYNSDSYNSNSSSKQQKRSSSAYVAGIEKDGNFTVVKCSKGKDTRIHEKYGKCTDNFNMGSYSCSSVMKWAKERCNNR